MRKLKIHTKAWFKYRIGKEIAKVPINLFNQPFKIQSEGQAMALYLTQVEKGYQYQEPILKP
jgi:hypothetical protein